MKNRELTSIEHIFAWSPFSLVSAMARIKGKVGLEQLQTAAESVKNKHHVLQTAIRSDANGRLEFISVDKVEIPVQVIKRSSDSQWKGIVEEHCSIPFDFEKGPPVRFILVQSEAVSELLVLCHHIICDGISLAYLAKDMISVMGGEKLKSDSVAKPIPLSLDNMPSDVSLSRLVKFFIRRMNVKWDKEKVVFDQEDYRSLNEAYWTHFSHRMESIELSESQTSSLVQRCRENGVSVNSALTAAFVGAQKTILGDSPTHSLIGTAADLRKRVPEDPGTNMGFYAGMIRQKFSYDTGIEFWDNARNYHRVIKSGITNKKLFGEFLSWLLLDPTLIAAINFKKLGGLATKVDSTGKKLTDFSRKKDVVSSILKREKMDSPEHKIMGTAVTNLTKLDFPRTYGDLELDRMTLYPGGAFPLSNLNLVVGAVTCSGKLSLLVEYENKTMNKENADSICRTAMEFLSVELQY